MLAGEEEEEDDDEDEDGWVDPPAEPQLPVATRPALDVEWMDEWGAHKGESPMNILKCSILSSIISVGDSRNS